MGSSIYSAVTIGLDKNLLVFGIHAEQNSESGWSLSGDVELEKGAMPKPPLLGEVARRSRDEGLAAFAML